MLTEMVLSLAMSLTPAEPASATDSLFSLDTQTEQSMEIKGRKDGIRIKGRKDGIRIKGRKDGIRIKGRKDGIRI